MKKRLKESKNKKTSQNLGKKTKKLVKTLLNQGGTQEWSSQKFKKNKLEKINEIKLFILTILYQTGGGQEWWVKQFSKKRKKRRT